MQDLGVFAENDAPSTPSYGVFFRPGQGWFAQNWTESNGPFLSRQAAAQFLDWCPPGDMVPQSLRWQLLAKRLATYTLCSMGLLGIFWALATLLIKAEQQGIF